MSIEIYTKEDQAYGAFNGGEIIENKPLGFPQDGGSLKPFSNLFYWANAIAVKDSTIGLHPHKGFEIMSFVLDGMIKHYDTKIQEWKELHKGDVQIIRSGNGISHAEFMQKDGRMFQIWFDPNLSKTMNQEASYDDYAASDLPVKEGEGYVKTTYVGGSGPIKMDALVDIFKIETSEDILLDARKENHYSIYVLEGDGMIEGKKVGVDDFAIIKDVDSISLSKNLSLFIVSGAEEIPYQTYAQMMRQ